MASEPETEVASCPACHHLLRVPLDWLGQPVQCPECRAMFRAPTRDGCGGLTTAELISRPTALVHGRNADAALWLPAFGLLLTGVAGVIVNGVFLYLFLIDPAGGVQWARNQLPALRQAGFGAGGPPEEQARRDEQDAARIAAVYRVGIPIGLMLSLGALLGGLSIVRGRHYRVAQVGCVLAAVNLPHLCCVPGAIAGLWGLLMLSSAEGQAHFGRR